MGLFFGKYKSELIEYSEEQKYNNLQKIYDNFINKSNIEVTKINSNTCYGRVDENWKPEHTNEMKEFFLKALNKELIIEMYAVTNHIKTGNVHYTIKIYENIEQNSMLDRAREKKGKAIKLSTVSDTYSLNTYETSSWYGSYYHDKLCGNIKFN